MATDPALVVNAVRKRFGATVALDSAGLTVQRGSIHAILGENGAGKSTLVKIMAGAVRPDVGSMTLAGQPYAPASPMEARIAGVAMVHQELCLALHLTVEQNIALGIEPASLGIINTGEMRRCARAALDAVGRADISPGVRVGRLPPAQRQLVEIARALGSGARVIILDEPTSSLGLTDIRKLFTVLRGLRDAGTAIVYISHFLEEIREVADEVTILRDGRVAASGLISELDNDQIVAHMIGRRMTDLYARSPRKPGKPLLEAHGLSGHGFTDVSLDLHRGEVLGIAGLVGSGRTELLRGILGLDRVRRGDIHVGAWNAEKWSPNDVTTRGLGMLSEDRRNEGLAVDRSIQDNLLLGSLDRFHRVGWLKRQAMRLTTLRWINQLTVRTRGPGQIVGELSGGNQQKIALARLLARDVDVLLLDEPTRGIDVGSKAQIYALINELASLNKGVVLVSSHLPELLGVCDTIAVIHRGRVIESKPAAEWNEHALLLAACGTREAAA